MRALQRLQRVHRKTRAAALNFAGIHPGLRHVGKGQFTHRKAVLRRRQSAAFVRGLARGHHAQLRQPQLRYRGLRQRHVAPVRRVKRAAKHANAYGATAQTQSRATRNWEYKAASGVPGAGTFW